MTPATRQMIATLSTEWHEHFSERAAIREFDGQLSREEAETLAFNETTTEILRSRVRKMADSKKPRELKIPKHEPVLTGKALAAGDK